MPINCLKLSYVPLGFARAVASAIKGSSGQKCLGYLPLRSFLNSSYVDLQKFAKSWVTCTGRRAGDNKWSLSTCRPLAIRGVSARPNNS